LLTYVIRWAIEYTNIMMFTFRGARVVVTESGQHGTEAAAVALAAKAAAAKNKNESNGTQLCQRQRFMSNRHDQRQ